MERTIWHKALQAPNGLRTTKVGSTRHALLPTVLVRRASSAPTIASTSFWKSLIPKPLRRKEKTVDWGIPDDGVLRKPKSKEWNPATFYIVIFMFIGSMSIQMIALRKEFNTFMRRSETRIGVLREVVEKLQRGEDVDVEKALGTGDVEKEMEWEEVLKELERDDAMRNSRKNEKNKRSSATKEEPKPEIEAQQTPDTEPRKEKAAASYSNFF